MGKFNHCEQAEIDIDKLKKKVAKLEQNLAVECGLNDRLHIVIEDWKKMYEEERRGANRLENALHALLPLR